MTDHDDYPPHVRDALLSGLETMRRARHTIEVLQSTLLVVTGERDAARAEATEARAALAVAAAQAGVTP